MKNIFKFDNFKYGELLKKILITIFILSIYRIISLIVLPGVDLKIISNISEESSFLKFLNIMTGGGIDRCSILSMGIMPYINATIITQILTSKIGFDEFKKMKKDREMGSIKMNNWTKGFTLFIAFINSYYFTSVIVNMYSGGKNAIYISNGLFYLLSIFILVTGSIISIWLANQISKFGIGQGTSLLIFVNTVSSSPKNLLKIYSLYKENILSLKYIFLMIIFYLFILCFSIFVESCTRKIAIRTLGIKGNKDIRDLPLKINNAGVMTAIMVSAVMNFPQLFVGLFNKIGLFTEVIEKYISYISYGGKLYYVFYSLMLISFTITQTEIVFDPDEIAYNLQESNIILVNTRPGLQTQEKIKNILFKLTILSAGYLIILCVVVDYICVLFNRSIGLDILKISGTSMLITVNIAQTIYKEFIPYEYKKLMSRYF